MSGFWLYPFSFSSFLDPASLLISHTNSSSPSLSSSSSSLSSSSSSSSSLSSSSFLSLLLLLLLLLLSLSYCLWLLSSCVCVCVCSFFLCMDIKAFCLPCKQLSDSNCLTDHLSLETAILVHNWTYLFFMLIACHYLSL